MSVDAEALQNADELINSLSVFTGIDYKNHRNLLADEIWVNGHWRGNYDVTVSFPDGTRSIRAIQEDEWDQTMSDDPDRPTYEKMIDSSPVYFWFADDIS